ncbi:glucosamine-6-phosphate deaminase [Arthrobacter caoxuetaonis]|uniref:glucosamine-6-phosphate deaminase n=1 Tax=Arthrobacter caoxuetaonis TaxID=2886935 RepID=UPI001D14C17C|nr:glucosamine-6-phosphate deaminase [Arthrobacter caoxuetaonis]MCC3282135.1 glucosamine-6-phosphate deaminase [Arthrobacter caoxuetaonis]
MSVQVLAAASPRDLGLAAADVVLARLAARRNPVLGIATGSSPLPLYEQLARRAGDLSPLRGFALDEYLGLPPGHPQSYHAVVRREVIDPLGLDPAAVQVPDGAAADPDLAADRYEAAIRTAGGIDVQVLGIGSNGHLAFNEPGSALDSRTRVVALTASTREANARFFPSLRDVPTHALTQGLGTIREARSLVLLASGPRKAQAIAAALTGPVTPDVPASVLQLHPDVTVLLSGGAEAALDPAEYSLVRAARAERH